jgi:hypothetical protein
MKRVHSNLPSLHFGEPASSGEGSGFQEIEQKQVLELRKKLGLIPEQTSTQNEQNQKKDGSAA